MSEHIDINWITYGGITYLKKEDVVKFLMIVANFVESDASKTILKNIVKLSRLGG